MQYSYGRSDHRLEKEDFGPDYHDAIMEAGKAGGLLKQMIWIFNFFQSLPEWLAVLMSPSLDLVIRIQRVRRPEFYISYADLESNTLLIVHRATDCPSQSSAAVNLSRSHPPDSFP